MKGSCIVVWEERKREKEREGKRKMETEINEPATKKFQHRDL